ncbi:MAG: BCCT family transporter [Chitinophagales bacterium]
MNNQDSTSRNLSLKSKVFFPPILFLLLTIAYSLQDNEHFLSLANGTNEWILHNFGWLFTWSTFLFLVVLLAVYFSPLASLKIGGKDAQPILTKWRWFAIALCTTIATGILFWGTAEPLYHLHTPPSGLGFEAGSSEAARFAMSTMFMHWSFTPYGIYTITGLAFALVYYNLKQPFSISSLLYPVFGNKVHGTIGTLLDIICLYGLSAGMAASLGTGIFAMMGGMETNLGIAKSDFLLGLIGIVIVLAFILSAVSGLNKGIRILSDINIKAFFVLAIVVFIFGPTAYILQIGAEGFGDYLYNFLPRSTNVGSAINADWQYSWTIFYFANWFAWAPVAALFLGRLAVGYTVRDFIHFNFLFPSIFTCFWMAILGGSALSMDFGSEGALYQTLTSQGEQNVMYEVLSSLPMGYWLSIFTMLIVFISYVTAADSNISAMSAISSRGISPENPEAPLWIKIVWGTLIGTIAWVMITSAGIDGIRLLCVLGGFPALFLIILVAVGIVKMMFQKDYFEGS